MPASLEKKDQAGAVRVLDDGRVEVEHGDFSAGTKTLPGGDVSRPFRSLRWR